MSTRFADRAAAGRALGQRLLALHLPPPLVVLALPRGGVPVAAAVAQALQAPLDLGDFITKPCKAVRIAEPDWLWPRNPPIRARADKPTSWLAITLKEGKNRQVRRMTAAVGLPTLRLVRSAIGPFSLASHPLMPGEWCEVPAENIGKM